MAINHQIARLRVLIQQRRDRIYEDLQEQYFTAFGYYPDWNYGTEYANDWEINQRSKMIDYIS